MNAIDPKLVKVLALWRSTTHAGEKAAAQARAETMAAAANITFDEAVAAAEKPAPTMTNIFSGFDDHMERQEPGWKARRAAERSEKELQRLKHRAAILKRYGSEEAALAPCEREQMLRVALAAWRRPCEPPWQRWTSSVEGCDFFKPLSAEIRNAVTQAYPMPTTFSDAVAEHDYWTGRRRELEDVRGPDNYGDSGLDLVAEIRLDLIRDLVEHEIETKTLVDLHARFRFYRDMESHCYKVEGALFRDLEALLQSEHPSNRSTDCKAEEQPSSDDRDGQIRTALDADPSQSDQSIARSVGCSPSTVGKIRRTMGLTSSVRSVHRDGKNYQMTFGFGGGEA